MSGAVRLPGPPELLPGRPDAIIDLEILEKLSRAELRMLWTEELAEKPPASLGRGIQAWLRARSRQGQALPGAPRARP